MCNLKWVWYGLHKKKPLHYASVQEERTSAAMRKLKLRSDVLKELEGKDFGIEREGNGVPLAFRFQFGRVDHIFGQDSSVKVSCLFIV